MRTSSFAACACSALLALFLSACGEGAEAETSGPPPFGGVPGSSTQQPGDPGNPSGNPDSNPAENPAELGSTNAPGGSTNPETPPGNLPLNPDMTGGTGAPTQPGTTPPGTDPGTAPPVADPGTTPPGTDPGTTPPVVDPGAPPASPEPDFPPTALERPTRGTRNIFSELLGVPEDQVNGKVVQAVHRFFGIGTNESATPVRDTGYRVYYQLPQDPGMAFIWTSDSNDIRSEGMSYGMMIALQMDMQEEFDNLWRFARTFMQFPGNSNVTSWRYNFRWQGTVNTANANNWPVNFAANTGPAPDGDEYFAAALYLADRRWGSGSTGINYQQDADNIANAMINNPSANGNTPLFNAGNNLVVFFPSGNSAQFSDPSYVLPAFYELFAIDGSAQNAARWNAIADAGRNFLVASAHPTTGLHPDYANFNGTPNTGGSDHDDFKYDAWRVIMNMAVDYDWFNNRDQRWTTQANKYHAFFTSQLNGNNVRNALFNVDGSGATGGSSTALTLTLASGAAASSAANRADFVQAAWDLDQQAGQYRYYQECVYILALLSAAGVYGYEWAP